VNGGHPRPPREPRYGDPAFLDAEADETTARLVQRLGSPWIVPVLSADPIVYGDSLTPARPDAPLGVADAVTCALQVCAALALLHAAGWVGLGNDSQDIRVTTSGEGWRASIVLPHLPPRGRFSYTDDWNWRLGPVDNDLRVVVRLLRDLVDGYVPAPLGHFTSASDYFTRPAPSLGDERIDAVLRAMLTWTADGAPSGLPEEAVGLGLLLAPLSHDPDGWRTHLAALAACRPAELRRDWDRLITLGEAALLDRGASREEPGPRREDNDLFVIYPLARALHQRACAAYARGDDGDADLARCLALDPWCRYRVTRATIADARGDHAAALAELDDVIASLRNPTPVSEDELAGYPLRAWRPPGFHEEYVAPEAARALYARGVIRFHRGDLHGARADLDEAIRTDGLCALDRPHAPRSGLSLRPHLARGAVLRALVERGDESARIALVGALRTCERHDEARALASRVLADHPDDPKLVRRFARWFPGLTG
jgi:hypothetical protein